jgi:hypothetical protein
MKHLIPFMLATLLAYSGASHSQDIFLLLAKEGTHSILKVDKGAVIKTFSVGQAAVYGASEHAIATLSYKSAAQGYRLEVIDMSTDKVTASWPVSTEPVMQLSGPSRDIVLSDSFAYFMTIHRDDARAAFLLNQLSLADGSLRTHPLPAKFANPRLTDFEGTPLLYSWNGFGVFRFDPVAQGFEELVSRVDVADVISDEKRAARSGQVHPYAFANHVAVSGAGVFRLSTLGSLHQVLNPDMTPLDSDRSIQLGSAENILKLFATTFKDRPAIGVLRRVDGKLRLACLDTMPLKVLWETGLPDGAVVDSVVGSRRNAMFYVDRTSGSIKMITQDKNVNVARLPKSKLFTARLIAVTNSR